MRELSFLEIKVAHEVLFSPLHNSNVRIRPNYGIHIRIVKTVNVERIFKEITVIIDSLFWDMALFELFSNPLANVNKAFTFPVRV